MEQVHVQKTIVLHLLLATNMCTLTQKAVVTVPVADLVGQPMQTIHPDRTANTSYDQIPLSTKKPGLACPRMHQLLYNEVVEIVRTTGDEVCVRIPNIFYMISGSKKPQTTYWTLKKNIVDLNILRKQNNIDITNIPPPIDFNDNTHAALHNQNIITLIAPFHDKKTDQTFSVGTRFVRARQSKYSQKKYIKVYVIDSATMKQHIVHIPRKKCMIYDPQKTDQDRMHDFVGMLKQWAHEQPGCIPYVLGGCSFTTTTDQDFNEVACATGNNMYYTRNDNHIPQTGLDCTGIIARAAQVCGIPYFWKNSVTIQQCIPVLGKNENISVGNIILIRGHVMIVSDAQKNLLIEARSYIHGYGKVQEIALNNVFQGIDTYHDLLRAYRHKQPLKRIDSNGKVRDIFHTFSIHKIAATQ